MKHSNRFIQIGVFGALLPALVCAQAPVGVQPACPDDQVRVWFPQAAKNTPLPSQPAVVAVADLQGNVLGWVFSTDQIAPAVRGKRGEVGVWVGLAKQGTITGVKVGKHREDKKWFDKIRDPFYKAFEGKPADGSGGKPDAVTGATISSKAMINDVFGACQTVLTLPDVQSQR